MTDSESIRLKIIEADQRDVGKGIVRISQRQMADLGLVEYDVVNIKGGKPTSGLAAKAYPTDEDMDVVRMDGLIRSNSSSSIGQFVEVSKAEWSPAEKVTLAPVGRGIQIDIPSETLTKVFSGRPVSKGDVISTTTLRRPASPPAAGKDSMFDEIFKRPERGSAFGFGEVKMRVLSTVPAGTMVRISADTKIELIGGAVDARQAAEVVYEDLGGMRHAIQRVREMIELPLKHPELFERLGIDPPRGVLLHGPPGTGKTMLAKAVANESSAHFASINGPEVVSKYYGESEKRIREVFEESERNAPAIIFLDELDSIAPKREEVAGEMERRMVAQLLSLMDGLKERTNVIVIGATNRPDAVDPALRRPGRFDREIELGVPDFDGRREILQIHTRGMPLAQDVDLEEFAQLTYGFVGADIAAFTREAAMNALRRVLPKIDLDLPTIPAEILEELVVTRGDLSSAIHEVSPSALREILIEVPMVTWADVGGLEEVKQLLVEAVEWPLVYGENFRRLGIDAPKGVLLYGPPGTGKTLLAKAVANESNANFITTKGSEILSKWYGESERHIAEIFRKARQVAPAIVFLDELDSLAPVRGGGAGEPHVTERIVNQLLSEIDGMEELRGVVVIGATNRPDIIDPALVRPGRFDELIMVPVPDAASRKKIFAVHTGKMPLADDVDLEELVERTEEYTGADIASICRKAGRLALREDMDAVEVRKSHFLAALEDVGPSVTPDTMRHYAKLSGELRKKGSRAVEKAAEEAEEGRRGR